MKTILLAAAALFALPACATTPTPGGGLSSITYETGPCFGACPIYKVIVNADGTGTFEGQRFTAAEGRSSFTLTPAQWRAFVARLAPYRPRGNQAIGPGGPRCRMMATDHPSVAVTWNGAAGADRLSFYYGCHDTTNAALTRDLSEAPGLLPIAALIGPRG